MNPLLPELFVFQGFPTRKKIKVRNHLYQRLRTFVAERVGFEPTVGCPITSFQDWLLKPLGHLSVCPRLYHLRRKKSSVWYCEASSTGNLISKYFL